MNSLKLVGFTVLVTAFYSYVGQMVPQKETYPPQATEFSSEMSAEELRAVGEEIVGGKGTCLGCHTVGETSGSLRFPDLGGIGAVAGARRPGMSDVEYLAESLYDPGAFIVEGFQPGMPPVSRPPIGLTDQEILAVIAYLQSLGGTPSVTLATELPYAGEGASPAPPAAATPAADGGAELDGPALFAQYTCGMCHSIDAPTRLVGPSLYDVGARLSRAEIYESLIEPDATVAEGFPGGVMGATLQASGFHEQVTPGQLKTLVDYLASMKGP